MQHHIIVWSWRSLLGVHVADALNLQNTATRGRRIIESIFIWCSNCSGTDVFCLTHERKLGTEVWKLVLKQLPFLRGRTLCIKEPRTAVLHEQDIVAKYSLMSCDALLVIGLLQEEWRCQTVCNVRSLTLGSCDSAEPWLFATGYCKQSLGNTLSVSHFAWQFTERQLNLKSLYPWAGFTLLAGNRPKSIHQCSTWFRSCPTYSISTLQHLYSHHLPKVQGFTKRTPCVLMLGMSPRPSGLSAPGLWKLQANLDTTWRARDVMFSIYLNLGSCRLIRMNMRCDIFYWGLPISGGLGACRLQAPTVGSPFCSLPELWSNWTRWKFQLNAPAQFAAPFMRIQCRLAA